MTTTTDHEHRSDSQTDAHADLHPGPQRPIYDDINVPVVFMVGVISMILTFLSIWFIEGIYYHWSNELVRTRKHEVINTIQAETIARQKTVLKGDEEKRITSFESVIDSVVGQYENRSDSAIGDAANPEEEHE